MIGRNRFEWRILSCNQLKSTESVLCMEIPAEFQHGCRLTNVQVPRLEQRQHSREPTDLDTAETPLTKVSNRNACRIGSKLNRGSLNNLKRGATSFREHQVIPGRLLRSEEIMPIPEVRSTPEPRTAMPHEREDTRHGNCLQRFEAAFSERIKQAEHRGWRVEADVARWLRQRWPWNPQPSQLRHVILHNTYYGRKGGQRAGPERPFSAASGSHSASFLSASL
jgi:hypothetical protein